MTKPIFTLNGKKGLLLIACALTIMIMGNTMEYELPRQITFGIAVFILLWGMVFWIQYGYETIPEAIQDIRRALK